MLPTEATVRGVVATLVLLGSLGPPLLAQEQRERAIVHLHAFEQAGAARSLESDEKAELTAKRLRVPQGFKINVFASGLKHPRMMDVDRDGIVYVTRRDEGDVIALRDTDGDGRADSMKTFAAGLHGVHGIAVQGRELFLASSTTVWRTKIENPALQAIVTGLPDGGQHPNRMLRFAPDGTFYLSIGSSCNDCAEENQFERGAMIRYIPDGGAREVIANGLRNTVGYDWHPTTRKLWGMDNGADFRGDDRPDEELNRIESGNNYGWPICDAAGQVDGMTIAAPERMALKPGKHRPIGRPMSREEYCRRTVPAVLTTTPHSAPLALRFYSASHFPAEYRGDAFVAMHGSWNRKEPAGYMVSRIRFSMGGMPAAFEPFLEGFVDAAAGVVYGRPAGLAIGIDGALLVSDDSNGVIYRVTYQGAASPPR